MAAVVSEGARPETPGQIPLPESPIYSYASTANQLSSYSLPLPPPPRAAHAVLSKADLAQSQTAYSDLVSTAKAYRIALATLSTAASAFGSALESCARLKEARAEPLGPTGTPTANLSSSFTTKGTVCTADLLLGASGVHHLIANHQQILSETVYRSFEVPLLHELDKWRRDIDDEDETYRREVAQQSREIRRLEKEGLKLHRQRRRDVAKFREHLVNLTSRLDGLTTLHADHARTMLRESQETSVKILDASCSLVRAEVDIFEGLARKGWSGGGLDDLLEKGHDLFASDEDALGGVPGAAGFVSGTGAGAGGVASGEGAKLFSILPPRSILADSASDATAQPRETGRADSLLVGENDRYQSLTGAVETERENGDDGDSIFSEYNQSRGMRPFSPQPIRRRGTDVIMDPESLVQDDDDDIDDADGDDRNGEEGGGGSVVAGGEGTSNHEDTNNAAELPSHEILAGLLAESEQLLENINHEEGNRGDDDDVESPWKNMGKDSEDDDDSDGETTTPRPIDIDNCESTAEERERRWNVTASEPGSP